MLKIYKKNMDECKTKPVDDQMTEQFSTAREIILMLNGLFV